MELSKKHIETIEKIYNSVKDYCSYVCLSGSSRCNYLDFHRDVDIFFVCPNPDDYQKCRNLLFHDEKISTLVEGLKKQHVILIPNTQDYERKWKSWDYYFLFNDDNPLFGDATKYYHKDVLKNQEEYLHALTHTNNILQQQFLASGKIGKDLYHLLTGVYILQNQSTELTPEQISNINKCHNGKEEDYYSIQLLLNYCNNHLKEIKNELLTNKQKEKNKKGGK